MRFQHEWMPVFDGWKWVVKTLHKELPENTRVKKLIIINKIISKLETVVRKYFIEWFWPFVQIQIFWKG